MSLLRIDGCGALAGGCRAAPPRPARASAAKFASPSSAMINRAAHQRGAAQAGENRAGEPLNGDAAAIDRSGLSRRPSAMEVRCRNRSAQRLVANDLDRAVCPDPSALSPPLTAATRLRRSPPQRPQPLRQQTRIAPLARSFAGCVNALARCYVIRTVTTGLSPMRTTREECGTSAARARLRSAAPATALSTARSCGRILRLSVLTRL